ncbi:hypothetical protein DIPPA_03775 [Diplonema papillatum]|nr:hypothetical protein DIPPA_03775 [Diplonema papillatum]
MKKPPAMLLPGIDDVVSRFLASKFVAQADAVSWIYQFPLEESAVGRDFEEKQRSLLSEIERTQAEKDDAELQVATLRSEIVQLRTEASSLHPTSVVASFKEALQSEKQAREADRERYQQLVTANSKLSVAAAGLKDEVASLKRQIGALEERGTAAEEVLGESKRLREGSDRRTHELEAELIRAAARDKAGGAEVKALAEERDGLRDRITVLEADKARMKDMLERLKAAQKKVNEQLRHMGSQLEEKDAYIADLLEEQRARMR